MHSHGGQKNSGRRIIQSVQDFFLEIPSALLILTAFFFFLAVVFNFAIRGDQTFVELAQSFLQGKLYLVGNTVFDTVSVGGYRYWPLGPFPAVLLMPFVSFFAAAHLSFYQAYLHVPLGVATFFLIFSITRALGYSKRDAWYWAFAFFFGSAFSAILFSSIYGYFAHMVTVFLLCAALYEYVTKKRPWLLGVYGALAAATRFTAGGILLFFVLDSIFLGGGDLRARSRRVVQLLAPMVLVFIGLGIYNELRFGSVFEQGYALQTLMNPALIKAREYGLMSLAHLPGNIFYAFFASPFPIYRESISQVLSFPYVHPSVWGTGIFFTSPYLASLFFYRYRSAVSYFLIGTSLVIALPIFLYYGIGITQFGYRYAFDFLPLLFFLLWMEYRKKNTELTKGMRCAIILSALADFYLYCAWTLSRT